MKSKATAADELKEFYQVDEGTSGDADAVTSQPSKKKGVNDMESRLDYLNKLARGEVSGSSSEDDENEIEAASSSEDENENEEADEGGGRDDPFAIPGDVIEESEEVESNRLAIQNCDWENLTAEDLMYSPPCPSLLMLIVLQGHSPILLPSLWVSQVCDSLSFRLWALLFERGGDAWTSQSHLELQDLHQLLQTSTAPRI
jgi:hypothetical protein